MALSPVLSLAQRALLANEAALEVVGNNISNVNTPGYSRQVPEFESNAPAIDASGQFLGTGVRIARVSQVVDPLLLRRLLGATSDKAAQGALSDRLGEVAGALNDLQQPSLASAVSGFFDAADALARNPSGVAERLALLGRAGTVVSELNRRSAAIADQQRGIDDRIGNALDEGNAALKDIARLNIAIVDGELNGQRANDLRDERQRALQKLAAVLPLHTVEDDSGSVAVYAANGLTLVSQGSVVNTLATRTGTAGLDGGPLTDLGFKDATGNFLVVAGGYPSGEAAGLVSARDTFLPAHSTALDTFANAFRDQVNTVQQAGVDLDGNSTALVPMFGGSGAGGITLLLDSNVDPNAPRKIAAALTTQPGDNQNVLALADLRTASVAALGNVSFGTYIAAEQGKVGEDASRADDAAKASAALADQLENQRQSISGVNLNEELTNLIKYQRAFQAASQVIRIADSLLQTLVNVVQ